MKIVATIHRVDLIALAIVSAIVATPAMAATSPRDACEDVAKKAQRSLWDSAQKTGDELFCRKPWVKRRPDELAACAAHTVTNKYGNQLKNKWNALFDKAGAEWATLGARALSVEWEEGTIRQGFKRTFFGAGLAYSRSTVEVVKEGGKAEASATVCRIDYDGKVVSAQRVEFPKGKGNENLSRKVVLENKDNYIVGVVVDTGLSLNSFEYRARLLTEPIRNDIGPVKGIADLHVHQLVNLTFGGRMYWGQHDGEKNTALAEEVITGRINPAADNLAADTILSRITENGLDANVLLWATNSKMTDEGFYRLGGHGHPSYRDWPHHADRSHQQVHISWVKEAHERGKEDGSNLRLMVVSLVHNDVLCSVLKFVDPYGNVPVRNSAGEITNTWESASWGCSDHENVLRQLEALHELERKHPWYRVAMNPWHARQIIDDGDLAVVISIETDKPLSGEGGNYGVWLAQLDEYRSLGVTTLQVVHESNSIFCGAAPHRKIMNWLQLVHFPLKSIANRIRSNTTFSTDGNGYNSLGLERQGEELIDAMVARNMPIDLAHGSQRCRKAIMQRVPESYGLYDSHTKFKRLLEPAKGAKNWGTDVLERENEFLIMESILPDYVKHKVLVGLRTASVDVYDAPNAKVDNSCPGSARSFAQLIQYAHDSGLDFAYGTDFNTGVSQLGPRFGNERCFAYRVSQLDHNKRKNKHRSRPASDEEPTNRQVQARRDALTKIDGTDYYVNGLANIGWLPELTEDLINLGTPGARRLRESAEAYLAMWERAYDFDPKTATNTTPSKDTEPGSLDLGLACTRDDQCGSGRCSSVAGARGVCVCNDDRDCGGGKFCNMGPDIKVNACQSLKADNEPCALIDGGRTCDSGECKLGRCYRANSIAMGDTCYHDGACKQGKCSSVDGTRGTCVCDNDKQCGDGYWCDKGVDLHKNSCKKKLNKGEICGTVGELGVGHRCKSGKCKTAVSLSRAGKLECK